MKAGWTTSIPWDWANEAFAIAEAAQTRYCIIHGTSATMRRQTWRLVRDISTPTKPVVWQAAVQALLLVAERDGPTMFARIGVMRALNRHVERVFNASCKDHHWGRRELARDR
jgi:hypothetical protein